jgi:hypothetical protein
MWIASSLLHGLVALFLTFAVIRGLLIITDRIDGYVGRDPKVWFGLITILVVSCFASITAWRSRNQFAMMSLRITAVGACLVVACGLFIVPLREAWVGVLNAAIASGGVWITAALSWRVNRHNLNGGLS